MFLLGLLAWQGRAWFAAATAPVWAGIDRVVSGPPVPRSNEPMRRAGPIVRKVLLLREGVEATDVPGGKSVETISRRIFADVYDLWPLRGETTHYRIGNRRPIGWVGAGDVLPWETRLVLRPSGGVLTLFDEEASTSGEPITVGSIPYPVLDWGADAVQVAIWEPNEPWRSVQRTGWVRIEEVGLESFGVLLNRFELLEVLQQTIEPAGSEAKPIRLMAVLGMIGEDITLSAEEIATVHDDLQDTILRTRPRDGTSPADQLGRINESWSPDASWSGIAYQAIPMEAFPIDPLIDEP